MFKVIIVDDEIYVVALINKLVDWENFQMKVEGSADNGIAALELVKEINPDLVIVDIRMPGYDGITFMEKVREFNHNVRFIVISGHKQFDYAKGAIRNNVEDYLLKPINKVELELAIDHVYKKLIQSQEAEYKIKEMAEELDNSKKRLGKLMVESIMKQEYDGFDESLEKINRHYLTTFKAGCYRMLSLHLDTSISSEYSQDKKFVLKETANKFKEALSAICEDVLECEEGSQVVFLLNYKEAHRDAIKQIIQRQVVECSKKAKKVNNLFFRICIGMECRDLQEIEVSWQSLWRCMLARTVMAEGKLVEEKDIRESNIFFAAILEYREERFDQALSLLNVEESSRCIREMYFKAFYGIEEDSLLYYKLFIKLLDKIWYYFNGIGIYKENEKEFKDRFIRIYAEASNTAEYPRILQREIESMVKANHLAEQTQAAPAIRVVKRYIREHYQEDISLSVLAELVNISPVYLSRLFKKDEGINFLDYLNQYRIEAAKKLLQDIHYNVIDVAELSGFHNTKYFSKIFKKVVGITPSEYRRRHLGKDNS